MKKVLVIVGPTASGKSALAVRLAKKFNGEILSADSRQVYRGLNIGTGKITKKEMRGVRHHLIDIANPKKRFSAAEFRIQAEKALDQVYKRGKLPIICGGTGFYIDTLLGNVGLPEAPQDPILRRRLQKKSVAEIMKILNKLDPARARKIDPKNKVRVIRSVEIAKVLGKVPLPNRKERFESLIFGIKISPETLKRNIYTRLEKRIRAGMIAEARMLHKRGLSYKRMRELGLEYGRLADYLQKKLSKGELIDRLRSEIWRYSRRQRRWFERNKKIIWIDYSLKNKLPTKKTFDFL